MNSSELVSLSNSIIIWNQCYQQNNNVSDWIEWRTKLDDDIQRAKW